MDATAAMPFLAVNADDIEWDANVTLFQLPTGAHKIHPNLKVKVLMRDDARGQVAHVAGKVLRRGDFHYAPPDTMHGPFEYPVGGIVFSVMRFPVAD